MALPKFVLAFLLVGVFGCDDSKSATRILHAGATMEQTRVWPVSDVKEPRSAWRQQTNDVVGVVASHSMAYLTTSSGDVVALKMDSGEVAWKTPLNEKIAYAPAVAGDLLFVGTDQSKLHLINPETGERLGVVKLDAPLSADPAVVEDAVMISTMRGSIFAVPLTIPESAVAPPRKDAGSDADKDGKDENDSVEGDVPAPVVLPEVEALWQAKIAAPITASVSRHQDQLVIAGTDGFVYAMSFAEGKKLWTYEGQRAHRHPAVFAAGHWFVGSQDGRLVSLDATTGVEKWQVTTAGPVSTALVATPEHIIASNAGVGVTAYSVEAGEEIWRYTVSGGVWVAPVGSANTLYVVSAGGTIHAIDLASGELRWAEEKGASGPMYPVNSGLLLATPSEVMFLK